jgi:chemotaxis family two-component system sensor kinase Cph1
MTIALQPALIDNLRRSAISLAVVMLAALLLHVSRPTAVETALLVLLAAISIGAWYGGLTSGLTATVASALFAAYLFIEPLYSFRIASPRDLFYVCIVVVQGASISWLCENRKRLHCENKALSLQVDALSKSRNHELKTLQQSRSDLRQVPCAIQLLIENPLRTIQQGREYLAIKLAAAQTDPHESREVLARMIEAERSIDTFRTVMLDYARERRFTNETASSSIALRKVLKDLAPVIDETRATVELPANLPALAACEADLCRIFREILENSIKFRSERPPIIHVSCCVEEGQCGFTITDNGVGMIPLQESRALTLFGTINQFDPARLGAGLAIARRIVENYGGSLRITSLPGEGTTVEFSLPRA